MEEVDITEYKDEHTDKDSWLTEDLLKESYESTKRMMVLCEETQEIGCKTAITLNKQGEQLLNIEGSVDKMNEGLRLANKNLNKIEKFCGICMLPFRKMKKMHRVDDQEFRRKIVRDQPKASSDRKNRGRIEENLSLTKLTGSPVEDEIEENISQVSAAVGNLKSIAINMSEEIDHQNSTMARISSKQDCNLKNLDIVNYRTGKLKK